MDIVILKDGTPVRFDDTFTNKSFDGITGFLLEFDFLLLRFRHYQKDDFKISDQEKWTQLDGYYKEIDYQNYMLKNSSKKYESLLKFDFSKLTAVSGDIVNVDVLYLDEPYDYYFKNATYRFSVQNTIDNLGIKNYRKPIYQNVTLIGFEIDIPNNLIPLIQEKTPKNLATRYFYEANFGDFVDNWQVFSSTKRNLKKIVTQICFRISSIVRDIFPYITDLSVVDANADLKKDEFSGLNDYNTIIFELKKSWGYYYIPNSDPVYVNRQKIEPTFSGEPNYDEYLKYYEGLTNFYFNVYKIRSNFITLSDDRRFNYLLGMISPAALAVIPLKIIKKYLSYYSKTKELDEAAQRFIVHLISSIIKRQKSEDIDDFLLFLLDKQNGVTTNFEVLYGLLTDGRVERIPYINMIFDEYTNKKYFAYAIYELWKVSKFNWDYFPPGTIPIPGQIYDGNFFIKNHDEFNTNNIFEFSSVDNVEGNLPFNTKVTFTSYFKNNKIDIYQTTRVLKYYIFGPLADEKVFEEFGLFHLYQPITLIGYEPSLDLSFVVPQRGTIPAFLFHFAEEYKKIAEFDALISLSVDLTVNILLAYFGGGSSLLKNLNYLRYTKLGAAIIGEGVIATEAVVIWRNAEGTANIITLSVAELMAVNQYLTTTTTDELEQKYLIRIQQLFLVLLIIGIGGTLYTRARATEAATRILDDIALLGTAAHGVPESILQILRSLKGEVTVTVSEFLRELKLINAEFPIGNILFKYEFIFDEATQFKFWLDFQKLKGPSWIRLNASADYLTNWITLRNKGIVEANVLDFITNQKLVDGILMFYEKPSVKQNLLTFEYDLKVRFLNNFGNIKSAELDLLDDYSDLIEIWKNFVPNIQVIIGNGIDELLKLESAKGFLKIGDDAAVAELFGLSIHPSKTLANHPGIRYLTDESMSESLYEECVQIASRIDDVEKISINTGIPIPILNSAKENYWIKERLCLNEVMINGVVKKVIQRGRFTKTEEDIIQWKKAIDGEFINETYRTLEEFKSLIAHEYVEGQLIDKYNMNFRGFVDFDLRATNFGAHDIAPLAGRQGYANFGRYSSPPFPNLNTWDNLDEIVYWYKNFYKLK